MAKRYFEENPFWYKDAVIYELHVKSFFDSDDDGIGDFAGLTQKLDYLESLGVTVLWLLPFYPSPLKDDGYDIADYTDINPDFGTLRDFKEFLKEAHKRQLRVVTELVINHTSDQHAWFQRARRSEPGSVYRNYYVWSNTPDKYQDARVIFTDFESSNWAYDNIAREYYWHRFYSHQPDLNFDNPSVVREIFKVLDFWFEMGVDGLRLDAVPYLFERQGTNCENLPETYTFLKKLRAYVDSKYKDKMLIAEANQWPQDAVAYLGKGDMCHMAFHFPLMPRLFMAVQMEDRFPIVDIIEETPAIPANCQWGLFLRNHDELTLEMVTDEERDYMYRIYALDPRAKINLGIRRRLAPLLDNNRRKIELMTSLLLSLPGTPIIYYGDEIGMGDNFYLGDRNGVRTPMQWGPDRNAGFSRANPQKINLPVIIDPEYHYEAINVENQSKNLSSLLWWTRRVLAIRKRFKAFGRGDFKVLTVDNPKVLAFSRNFGDEHILVVVNLSRFPQAAQLDTSDHKNSSMREIFSQSRFGVIKDSHYGLTIGPHGFFWFELMPREVPKLAEISEKVAPLHVAQGWQYCLQGKYASILEERILPAYLGRCRWFGGKARTILRTRITEAIPMFVDDILSAYILILEVGYAQGQPEHYMITLSYSPIEQIRPILNKHPEAMISSLLVDQEEGALYDSVFNNDFRAAMLNFIAHRRRSKGAVGMMVTAAGKALKAALGERGALSFSSEVVKSEQSNTSFVYENKLILKLYRKLEDGMNPDLELQAFLSDKADFKHVPAFCGAAEYIAGEREPVLMGLLQGYVVNEGDGWAFAQNALSNYIEAVLGSKADWEEFWPPVDMIGVEGSHVPAGLRDMVGHLTLQMIEQLGRRTAQMHIALASSTEEAAFKPEPFTQLYQNSIYLAMRSDARKALRLLKEKLPSLNDDSRILAQRVVELEPEILEQYQQLRLGKIETIKIRIHGDYHLSQVLFTGKDFVIIDFEGEPANPLSERRLKRAALRDVAGMIRSFSYAAHSALLKTTAIEAHQKAELEPWMHLWYHTAGAGFMDAYISEAKGSKVVPPSAEGQRVLLRTFILQKALYELGYELNNRPGWVMIPLKGILNIIEGHTNVFQSQR
ncbi:MAG: maltose alpha-D-glucosyltransferase [Planctomycetes bacterium GWF2_50_10]|nr:MAG: maltose alpha-D-glucosyltransferase [Planctomycetes bacterium GWF2_50_10]